MAETGELLRQARRPAEAIEKGLLMTFVGDHSWIWILVVFVAYFATLIGIAVVRTPRMEDMSDYVLGGRRIGVITSALSSGSSSASGATMLVIPALAFAAGLLHLWTIVGITLSIWLTWTIMATPGFLIALPAAIVVTLLTRPPSDEITKLFDQVNGPTNTAAAGALAES